MPYNIDPYAGTAWGMLPPPTLAQQAGYAGGFGPGAGGMATEAAPFLGTPYRVAPVAEALATQAARPWLSPRPFLSASKTFLTPGAELEGGAAALGRTVPVVAPVYAGAKGGPYVGNVVEKKTGSSLWGDIASGATVGGGTGLGIGIASSGPPALVTVPAGIAIGALAGAGLHMLGMGRSKTGGGGGNDLSLTDQLTAYGATGEELTNITDIADQIGKVRGKDAKKKYLEGVVSEYEQQLVASRTNDLQSHQDLLTAQAMSNVLLPWVNQSWSHSKDAQQLAIRTGHPELAQQYMAMSDEVADAYAVQALMFGPQSRAASSGPAGATSLLGSLGNTALTNQAAG